LHSIYGAAEVVPLQESEFFRGLFGPGLFFLAPLQDDAAESLYRPPGM